MPACACVHVSVHIHRTTYRQDGVQVACTLAEMYRYNTQQCFIKRDITAHTGTLIIHAFSLVSIDSK